jgi:hypothetical protein
VVVPWGKMQRTICRAVDTFHWDSVIGHFNMVSDSSSDVGPREEACLASLMQKTCCLVVDTCWKNSVFIGHFNLLGGSSSDGKPREGGLSLLAGLMQQTICLAVNACMEKSVICHFKLVLTQRRGGGGCPLGQNVADNLSSS